MRIDDIRKRLWHALSPETAAAAGLSLQQLQQVVAGTQSLTEQQMEALERFFGMERYAR